jgi:uncharacterized membrane-anchored protein
MQSGKKPADGRALFLILALHGRSGHQATTNKPFELMLFRKFLHCTCALALAAASPATAEEAMEDLAAEGPSEFEEFVDSLEWATSGTGEVGSYATIEVPEGYRYTGQRGTIALMEVYGNLTSGEELGFLSPLDMEWFAVFEFDAVGYVKDDEKDSLDAGAILKQLQEGQRAANKVLAERGLDTLEVMGWQTPPFYNPETKNLEWAIRLRSSDGEEVVNYNTKLLGRRGVMDVVVVCDEDAMDVVIPEYQRLLQGFAFKEEESYAAFTKGDKIAEYGLTGLIVGGGMLLAAKSGLLAKLWKPIAAGLLAVGVFLKRIFRGRTPESI